MINSIMKHLIWVMAIFFALSTQAQSPLSSKRSNAVEIYKSIEKLNFLGSALYVAAHPDDENTRLISYLSNELKANTAYLSLTRGDGGQNLIGTEIREELGVIRTQELLMARSVDGGSQFFTRANDFGYSKHPDETFEIWNKKEVLGDAIWVMRNFKPDVIVNRFDHRTPGKTHGHHTGSAMLSLEAFKKAADKNEYPEQLKHVDTWQTNRIFFNTSWWFYGSREKFAEANKDNMVSVDIGKYDPVSGSSISEIAIRARSKHLSQGFGSTPKRGSQQEFLEFIDGQKPNSKTDIFEGINTTWSRVKGGEGIGLAIQDIIDDFDFTNPTASMNNLVELAGKIKSLPDGYWKSIKQNELNKIIEDVAGLYLEAYSAQHQVAPGDSVEITIETTNRTDTNIKLNAYTISGVGIEIDKALLLENNVENKFYETIKIPSNIEYSTPYWLNQKGTLGMYNVQSQLLRGKPETPPVFNVAFDLSINDMPFTITKEIIHKYSDPAVGEVYKPFEITPHAFVSLAKDVYLFADESSKDLQVEIRSGTDNIAGKLSLQLPSGWKSEPNAIDIELEKNGSLQKHTFKITPPKERSEGEITAQLNINGKIYDRALKEIEYSHIPYQTVLIPAKSKLVRIPMVKAVDKIAYIMGAGDKVPENLRDVGYQLDVLELEDLSIDLLKSYDAVILGIRIYNVNKRIALYKDLLFEYVDQGGTLITQYNTSRRISSESISPFELTLSRDRVTDEFADVKILEPDHAIINFPNKITDKDFEGWVQERGLYFPNEWGPEFTPILSCHDKGEDPKQGGLLVAEHGQGHFIYTGYSWFRELPAGVAGAYRIFANMIAIGKSDDGSRP